LSSFSFLRQIKAILLFIISFLAPNDVASVWEDIIESEHKIEKQAYDRDFEKVMQAIADSYTNSYHWSTKRQLLSIVAADVPFRIIEKYILDLTRWKFYEARRQAKLNG